MYQDELVEAIEEGRIVKVSEFYAKREGLPIIRKSSATQLQEETANLAPSTTPSSDEKQLLNYSQTHTNWRDKQVISELLDNWHWLIRIERRKKGLTRKQFAKLLNEPENALKLIESGILPKKDFVLLNKIQQTLRINLRKDKKDFSKSITDIYPKQEKASQLKPKSDRADKKPTIYGSDIEILEDEI